MVNLKKTDITILIDSREQMPLEFKEAKTEVVTLDTGDYSLRNFENEICIERKSLSDLLDSLGVSRERFMRETQRMKAYSYKAIIIEATLTELIAGEWRSKITPQSVMGSLLALNVTHGINIIWATNHELTAHIVEGLLFYYLKGKIKDVERIKNLVLL
ncbi:MAG: ERCC4 domain-containing protein [Candidatus Anammoxibacter sp.]